MPKKAEKDLNDPSLTLNEMNMKIYARRRALEKEERLYSPNHERLKRLREELDYLYHRREKYHENSDGTHPNKNGYFHQKSSPEIDAAIAHELCYPKEAQTLLLNEPNERIRMRILESCRQGKFASKNFL